MFADPPRSLYLVLAVATIITGAVCAYHQTRRSFLAFFGIGSILLALYLLDTFVESPREESSRRVKLMAAAATQSNPRAFLEHVASTFEMNGRRKVDLESSPAWGLIRQYSARIAVWGFTRDDFRQVNDSEIEIGFSAKAEEGGGAFLQRYVRATFIREGDAWRMNAIRFYDLKNLENLKEDPVPGFP